MDFGSFGGLLVYFAIVAIICVVLWWGFAQLPAPFNTIGRIVVAVVVVLALLNLFAPMLGHAPVIRFGR